MEHAPRFPQQLHNVHTMLALLIKLTLQIGKGRMLKVTSPGMFFAIFHLYTYLLLLCMVVTPRMILTLCGSVEVGNSQGLSICG